MIRFLFRRQMGALDLHAEASLGRERVVITGENGSGKTTLLRLFAGLDKPDDGYLHFYDHAWADSARKYSMPIHERRLGCVFAEPNLLPWLSVADNICIGVSEDNMQRAGETLGQLARTLKLYELLDKKGRHLSAGEAQRVTLARAFIAGPSMLLLDEPFSAQSPKMRAYLREWLLTLHEKLEFPMILVTHDLDEATYIGQRHWFMRNGKLIMPKEASIGRRESYE
jgi:molybdate transport system ATP-binding protein